jgi:hypothetical protein
VIWHVPVEQLAVPCGFEQAMPHPLQFVAVRMSVSQPFRVLPSQSA